MAALQDVWPLTIGPLVVVVVVVVFTECTERKVSTEMLCVMSGDEMPCVQYWLGDTTVALCVL